MAARGWTTLSFALVCEELGRADSSVRGFLTVHAGLVAGCIAAVGHARSRSGATCRGSPAASGSAATALTEPDAGSDAASMQTTARAGRRRLRAEWRENLDHQRHHRPSRHRLRHHATAALRHKGICAFLVETDTPGFRREPMPGKELGHRASDHAHITLRGLPRPASALLGAAGRGLQGRDVGAGSRAARRGGGRGRRGSGLPGRLRRITRASAGSSASASATSR